MQDKRKEVSYLRLKSKGAQISPYNSQDLLKEGAKLQIIYHVNIPPTRITTTLIDQPPLPLPISAKKIQIRAASKSLQRHLRYPQSPELT